MSVLNVEKLGKSYQSRRVIAAGEPDAILNHQQVRDLYLVNESSL